jgi:hypothetical protein
VKCLNTFAENWMLWQGQHSLESRRQLPANTPVGQPTVATGVNSGASGVAIGGGNGYAIVRLR